MSDFIPKWKDMVKYIRDPGLIFIGSLFIISLGMMAAMDTELHHVYMIVALGIFALPAVWLYYRKIEKAQKAEEARALASTAQVITPQDYASALQEWDQSGEGCVLLYNIELQSFKRRDILQKTWGRISQLENIKKIILLLPEHKVRRWEHVVLKESQPGGFFADPANRKFEICQTLSQKDAIRKIKTDNIAFALYRYGANAGGKLDKRVVLFPLSEPFSTLHMPDSESDDPWWDYHHILSFSNDSVIRDNAMTIWNQYYTPDKTRNVDRVLKDTQPLRPIEPSVFFTQICVSPDRYKELMSQFKDRQIIERRPAVISQACESGDFELSYDNGQVICGHYTGVDVQDRKPRPTLVCVGGFTEHKHCRLMELFERELRKESVLQFFYQGSPEIEHVTLSRYQEDMQQVFEYVNVQSPTVIPNKLVVVARSINAFIAALVASQPRYLEMLSGLVLVAPVFDVVDMMDNYRAAHGDDHVKVEKLWRLQNGFNDASEWEHRYRDPENPSRNWLHYFGHEVSLALMADIFRQPDPKRYRLQSFINSIGIISQVCRVCILSNPDDPITGSHYALERLQNAASGAGKIRETNFSCIDIKSSHTVEVQIDQYPFRLRQETEQTRLSVHHILSELGIPVSALSDAIA